MRFCSQFIETIAYVFYKLDGYSVKFAQKK